jgi:uncharacterized protein YdeI (YjbR/CyaY-like superfamily)
MPAPDLPIVSFPGPEEWAAWLEENHASSPGVWLRIAKKGSGETTVSYAEALDVALCHGWIDGQKRSHDEGSWLQKFTRRGARSLWSKVNREKALELIRSGRMRPAGQEEVDRAQRDGRWEAAYDAQSKASVPADLEAELERRPAARAFFATLNSQNRYAVLFRIQTAKRAETRARRIEQLVAMLERGEKIHS